MHTYKGIIILYIAEKLQFFSAVIISIDNQIFDDNIEITILKKNQILLSSKCINTSTKLINHKISTILSVFSS